MLVAIPFVRHSTRPCPDMAASLSQLPDHETVSLLRGTAFQAKQPPLTTSVQPGEPTAALGLGGAERGELRSPEEAGSKTCKDCRERLGNRGLFASSQADCVVMS